MSTSRDDITHGIAVDIGGSKVAIAVAEPSGEDAIVRLLTPRAGGADALIDQVAEAARMLVGERAIDRVVVASAGSLDTAAGVVRWASNLPFDQYPLVERLAGALEAPVTLVGDTTAATIAEFSVPARRGVSNGIYITVSSGIGAGMLFNGRIYTGYRGHAGELGHIPVAANDPVACRCGQRGCLEAYASGRGLVDRAVRMLGESVAQGALASLAAHDALDAQAIVEAAVMGDRLAVHLMGDAVEYLSTAIATTIRILGPEVLVLGGGLMQADEVLSRVRGRTAELLAFEPHVMGRLLVRAELGDRSPLEGARAICRRDPRALAMGADAGWA